MSGRAWRILAIAYLGLTTALSSLAAQPATPPAIDVSTLTVGAPTTVAELDLSKLKGELRQVGWSPDGGRLYIQTADGNPQSPKLHHYWVALEGGAVLGIEAQPDWAQAYWAFKSDRSAPGIGSLMIDLVQKLETMKVGTGQAGALDREAGGLGGNVGNIETLAKGNDQNQKQNVFRLTLLDETISEFVNERPIPGLMFGWGPEKSGAIAFTDRDGRLMLLDQKKHKRTVAGAKDALLPAWTTDGSRLAWVQKSGRRKYTLLYATVTR
jgi:hypothetical protein